MRRFWASLRRTIDHRRRGELRADVVNAAMDPSTIQGFIQASRGLEDRDVSVQGCEVTKVRLKANRSLELLYKFRFGRAGASETVTATVVGRLYPDEGGERAYRTPLGAAEGRPSPVVDSSLPGFPLYIPELRLLLTSAEEVVGLPGLRVALEPDAMQAVLGHHAAADLSGCEGVGRCEIDVLRHKPGWRCTLRYRLEASDRDTGAGPRWSCIGKIYDHREEGERAFANMLELERRGFGRDARDGIRIPLPLGYLRELRMVLMEYVAEPTLDRDWSSPRLFGHLKLAGRALAKLHASPLSVGRQRTPEGEVAKVTQLVTKVTQLIPDLTEPIQPILNAIIRSADELRRDQRCLIHGNFAPPHILVGEHVATIVDLDSLANGDPALDLGKFLARLRWRALAHHLSEEEGGRYGRAFLAAYRPSLPPELRRSIEFYYQTSFLSGVCMRSLRPEWRNRMPWLLAEAAKPAPFLLPPTDR